jgi:hypothetical protein
MQNTLKILLLGLLSIPYSLAMEQDIILETGGEKGGMFITSAESLGKGLLLSPQALNGEEDGDESTLFVPENLDTGFLALSPVKLHRSTPLSVKHEPRPVPSCWGPKDQKEAIDKITLMKRRLRFLQDLNLAHDYFVPTKEGAHYKLSYIERTPEWLATGSLLNGFFLFDEIEEVIYFLEELKEKFSTINSVVNPVSVINEALANLKKLEAPTDSNNSNN